MQHWSACALIIASRTSLTLKILPLPRLPPALFVRVIQSAVARIAPRLSEGWLHSAASHAALERVCPDHCLKDISDLEDLAIAEIASSLVCSCDPVGSCEDRPQVV